MTDANGVQLGALSAAEQTQLHDERADSDSKALRPGHGLEPNFQHGAYSMPTLIPEADSLAAEIRTAAAEQCPWLTPLDEPVLQLYCLALSRISRAENWLAQGIEMQVDGRHVRHRRLVSDLRAWVETARRLAGVLGLEPTARMGLKVGNSRSKALDAVAGTDPADVAALEGRILERLGAKAAASAGSTDAPAAASQQAGGRTRRPEPQAGGTLTSEALPAAPHAGVGGDATPPRPLPFDDIDESLGHEVLA